MKHAMTILASLMLALSLTAVQAQAQETTTVFFENFDSVTPPALPAGWLDASLEWTTSSSVASTGSGLNNLTVAGAQAASVQTPVLDLSAMTSGSLSYLVRRTSTYAQDSLIVTASLDGGASFSVVVLDRGAALPPGDGSYEAVSAPVPSELLGQSQVVLMFTALGGSTSGANIRIDDVEMTGDGGSATTPSVLAFATETGAVDPAAGTFEVDLILDFNHADSLQGIQFDVSWDVAEVNLAEVIRGDAVASTADWDVIYEAREAEMRAVLLGDRFSALPEGLFSPIVTLRFSVDPAATADEVVLTLGSAIGALAVRTGDDAGLTLGLSTHTVSLAAGTPVFSADAGSLDIGSVMVESTGAATLTVSNTGAADLVISDVATGNPIFTIAPLSATLAPGASTVFTITFAPTFTVFGFQEAALTFSHNGAGGSDVIAVSGTGLGGRGDMSEDGLVDALDLVLGIDYVLERETPTEGQHASADVFPFGAPDGGIDVRDLTVLVRAIVLGVWPDEVALPVEPPAGEGAGKNDGVGNEVAVEMMEDGGETKLALHIAQPVRAVQITLGIPGQVTRPALVAGSLVMAGVRVESHFDPETGAFRLLAVRMDGGSIAPGRYELASVEARDVSLLHGVAVDVVRQRVAVGSRSIESTAHEDEEDDRPGFRLGAPYPNPFVRGHDARVSIPLTLDSGQSVNFEVFDILGREIFRLEEGLMRPGSHDLTWDGSDARGLPVAPGLYLLRLSDGDQTDTRLIVVE